MSDYSELIKALKSELLKLDYKTHKKFTQILEDASSVMEETILEELKWQNLKALEHPHPRSRIYRSEPQTWSIKNTTAQNIFKLIKEKTSPEKTKTACIFDLDGTLFDVGYRTLGIITEWAESFQARKFDKNLIRRIKNVNYHHLGYSLIHAFENAGFDLRNQYVLDMIDNIESFWKRRFFDGKALLSYDGVIRGGPEFLQKLKHELNVEIFYLTGRYEHSMREGTEKQLTKEKILFNKKNLILKDNPSQEDHIYKAYQVKKISETYRVIANFENEYANLNFMAQYIPKALHVIVDSHHSGRYVDKMEDQVHRIMDFECYD